MKWTRRRTYIGGDFAPDDWTTKLDGQDVGRVYLGHRGMVGGPWKWVTWVQPVAKGEAETLEEALSAVKEAVARAVYSGNPIDGGDADERHE